MSPLRGFTDINNVFYNHVSPSGLKFFVTTMSIKPRRGGIIIELQNKYINSEGVI